MKEDGNAIIVIILMKKLIIVNFAKKIEILFNFLKNILIYII